MIKSNLSRIQSFLHRLEDGILVILISLIIGMAATQILLRNLFEGGIVWGDVLVRILVLWIGLVGAMVASRKGEHINIDVITRHLPKRFQELVNCITGLFTALVCAIAAFYSLRFVIGEFEDGVTAFALVPAWICESIIPVSFFVIALRYLFLSINHFSNVINFQS